MHMLTQPPRDPREQAVILQHPSAPVIYTEYATPASTAYAKAQADAEIVTAQRHIDAIERCKAAGVPRQLLDLFEVDGIEKVCDWLQVCVLELGKR